MYTSGCPKNQKKCWYNTGSPPKAGSIYTVLYRVSDTRVPSVPVSTGSILSSSRNRIDILTGSIYWIPRLRPGHCRFDIVL